MANLNDKPLVTIITVTYNCINDIEATIRSVLSQDYPNIEYIIVDGASKDGTVDVIRKYEDKISKFVSEPDKGLYDAMNKGIRMATGQWCAFMNAGDAYTDSHIISALFKEINADSNKKVVYGNTQYVERDGTVHLHKTSTIEKLAWTVCRYQPYTHQAVFYNIDCKEDCFYDLRYKVPADYDVACRYWKKYGQSAYHYVPIVVCSYKAYDGVSTNPKNKRQADRDRILIKYRNSMSFFQIIKDSIYYLFRI